MNWYMLSANLCVLFDFLATIYSYTPLSPQPSSQTTFISLWKLSQAKQQCQTIRRVGDLYLMRFLPIFSIAYLSNPSLFVPLSQKHGNPLSKTQLSFQPISAIPTKTSSSSGFPHNHLKCLVPYPQVTEKCIHCTMMMISLKNNTQD